MLTLNVSALQAAAQLDGCYDVETNLKTAQADAQTIHDRYKDLALVERDFRTLTPVHPRSAEVVARQVPETSARQRQLLAALKLQLPGTVPEARVTVGTRKKINQVRKTLET